MTHTQDKDLVIITDDEMLQRRLERVLTSAVRRQLWITFLDDEDRETGVIIPCDDYPLRPEDLCPTENLGEVPAATVLALQFSRVMNEFGFASLVAIWERRGGDAVRAPERRWAAAFASAMRERGAVIRAQFLLHDRGMRHLAPDDLVDI